VDAVDHDARASAIPIATGKVRKIVWYTTPVAYRRPGALQTGVDVVGEWKTTGFMGTVRRCAASR